MNNSTKISNSKEVILQLKRAEVQKKLLEKDIYKEYEAYFEIFRKSLYASAEKGILRLYSVLSISDIGLNTKELNNFLDKNINLYIHSKLPLVTIEQLNLESNIYSPKQLVNVIPLKEVIELDEFQAVNFDYESELIAKESFEFHCNNNSNTYEHYYSLREDEPASVNLDESSYLNSFSKQNSIKKIEYEKYNDDSALDLIEEINFNKLNIYENINNKLGVFFTSSNILDFFENIEKSFSQFLLNLSYEINAELFKINLIKKIISEDSFKYLSNNSYLIKHPYPFVIKYDLNLNSISADNKKFSNLYLFNITHVELEFYNIELSICKNNINELKGKLRLLNKKQRYWKHKKLTLNNLN